MGAGSGRVLVGRAVVLSDATPRRRQLAGDTAAGDCARIEAGC